MGPAGAWEEGSEWPGKQCKGSGMPMDSQVAGAEGEAGTHWGQRGGWRGDIAFSRVEQMGAGALEQAKEEPGAGDNRAGSLPTSDRALQVQQGEGQEARQQHG